MKRYLSILLIAFIGSCVDDESVPKSFGFSHLTGTWQLVAASFSAGGSDVSWQDIENGYTYTFASDGTFSSDRYPDCTGTSYAINDSQLMLDFDCGGIALQNIEATEFRRGLMYLSPRAPVMCIEGCQYRFRKID